MERHMGKTYPVPRIKSEIKNRDLLVARRAELVRAAMRSFIQNGYANASVNGIARDAKISVGSMYKYVRRKEDVLWLVLDSIYRQLEERLLGERTRTGDPAEDLHQAIARFLRATYDVRDGLLLLYQECRNLTPAARREIMAREEGFMDEFSEIIAEGNTTGVFKCSSPQYAALNILMAGHALSLKAWMLKPVPLDEYITTQSRLLLAMVSTGSSAASADHAALASTI